MDILRTLFIWSLLGVSAARGQDLPMAIEQESREVTFTIRNQFVPGEKTQSITWTTLLPSSIPHRQNILDVRFSHEPKRTFERLGNTYAIFEFEEVDEPIELLIEVRAELLRYDLPTIVRLREAGHEEGRVNTESWLKHEKFIESDADSIRDVAATIPGDSLEERIENTLRFVSQTLRYTGYREESLGARRALEEREGDCSEFADLFVALCRAQGIPARTCDGILLMSARAGDTPRHKWAEVYFEGLGWVPVDPLRVAMRRSSLHRMSNDYLFLSCLRNDSSLNDYEIAFYRYVGDPIEFSNEILIHR